MNEEKKYNVVQANQFIRETSWTLKKDTIKIFKLLISRIDTKKPPKDNTIYLTKKEIINVLTDYKSKSKDKYTYARDRTKELITGVKVLDDEEREIYTALVQKVEWYKNKEMVSIQFSSDVMKYLLVITQFLSYDVDNIRGFHSKYGILFYEYLFSEYRQFKQNTIIVSVDDLRRLTATQKAHPRFDNWENKVLKAGIKDLNNAGVEILAKYEKIKEWNEVKEIKFYLRERTSYKETRFEEVYQTSLFDDEPKEDEERLLPWEIREYQDV